MQGGPGPAAKPQPADFAKQALAQREKLEDTSRLKPSTILYSTTDDFLKALQAEGANLNEIAKNLLFIKSPHKTTIEKEVLAGKGVKEETMTVFKQIYSTLNEEEKRTAEKVMKKLADNKLAAAKKTADRYAADLSRPLALPTTQNPPSLKPMPIDQPPPLDLSPSQANAKLLSGITGFDRRKLRKTDQPAINNPSKKAPPPGATDMPGGIGLAAAAAGVGGLKKPPAQPFKPLAVTYDTAEAFLDALKAVHMTDKDITETLTNIAKDLRTKENYLSQVLKGEGVDSCVMTEFKTIYDTLEKPTATAKKK